MLMVLGTSAASDRLSVGNYDIISGESLTFPVSLENETELSAFQCDVYLPEGITFALNEDGEFDVTLNPTRATSSHTITATAQSDGAVRIAAYSSQSKPFKGNSGELFYLNLTTDANVEGGQVVRVRNIIFSTTVPQGVPLEDVSSVVTMTRYVAKNELTMIGASVTSGESLTFPVSLENETELSAFQCDVYLPEGITFALNEDGEFDVTLNSDRTTSSHTITATTQSDGAVRIAAYSSQSKPFKGNFGELFYLNLITDANVEGKKVLSIKNVIFSTVTAEEVLVKDATSTVVMAKYVPKNEFVVRDTIMTNRNSFLFPVILANESELAAFQCNVYLPEGLKLALNEEGDLDVRLNAERVTSSHTITAHVQTDGSIRVVAYANPTKNFKGSDGVLFYLNLQSDKNVEGEKMIEIKNIICSTADASTVSVADVSAVVNISEPPILVSSIVLDKQDAEIVLGETITLTAVVEPEDADNNMVVWTSSDETVATVENGVVTTLKVGEAIITATTVDGSNLSAACTVRVIGSYQLTYVLDGETFHTEKVIFGTAIVAPEVPVKEGYTFNGWADVPETMPAYDVTITGTYTINQYTLIYVVDGIEYKTMTLDYNASIIAETVPTKEGYTFSGWSEFPSTMPAKDVTITGTFSVNSYNLVYMVDGVEFNKTSIEFGSAITALEAPIKEGYTFSGWSEVPAAMPAKDVTVTGTYTINQYTLTYLVDGAEYKKVTLDYASAITAEAEPTKEGHTFSGWSEIPATMPAMDVTVVGEFSVNSYQVTYMLDGKEFKVEQVVYGSPVPTPEVPAKLGYNFSGWGDVPSAMPAKDLTLHGSYTINKDNKYNVIYMVDGVEYKRVQYAFEDAIVPEAEPTKEGYTFSGWSEMPATMPLHDVTVVGEFTVNMYQITYMVDGEVYATEQIAYGSAIVLKDAPVKEGYIFSGWSEAPETMPAADVVIEGTFTVDGIEAVVTNRLVDVYTLQGVMVKRQVPVEELEQELPDGIYIVHGKKMVVK